MKKGEISSVWMIVQICVKVMLKLLMWSKNMCYMYNISTATWLILNTIHINIYHISSYRIFKSQATSYIYKSMR